MFRRSLISLLIAIALMALLAAAVGAQSAPDDTAPVAPSIQPMGAAIVQAVPLTLTVNIQGPDGMMTYEVPIVLSLDIQIALGNVLTTTVVVTPEVSEPVAAAPTKEPPAPTPVPPKPTAVPPKPTPEPPTATPSEAAPTEAAPTPVPVGQTPTAAPEEDGTPVADETATPEPGAEATAEPADKVVIEPDACSDSRSVIFAPEAGSVISGTVEVFGTANHERFSYYKLEYTPVDGDMAGVYAFILDSKEKVIDAKLAELDTTELDNGAYVLKLTVVDNTGNFPPPCAIPVEIAN